MNKSQARANIVSTINALTDKRNDLKEGYRMGFFTDDEYTKFLDANLKLKQAAQFDLTQI